MSMLNSSQAGTGPILVILHGLFGSLDNFQSIAAGLETDFTVLRLDLPAHGLSPAASEGLSFSAMADEVMQTLQALGIEQFFLLGHSLGGKVAMTLGGMDGSDPEVPVLLGLIVVDIAPRLYPPHHEGIITALKTLPLAEVKNRRDADQRLSQDIVEPDVRAFILKSLYRDDEARYSWRFDLDAIQRDYDLMRQVPPVASPITAPTLFIKGELSDYIQHSDEPAIREICQLPTFKEIGGTGHWPHAQKPVIFTKICLDFLLPLKESLV